MDEFTNWGPLQVPVKSSSINEYEYVLLLTMSIGLFMRRRLRSGTPVTEETKFHQ